MKKNTCIASKEWFEKKFLIINGFACLLEITIFRYKIELQIILLLSYDVAFGSEITPCNKICKPLGLVVYRFSGNVMTSITTLRT